MTGSDRVFVDNHEDGEYYYFIPDSRLLRVNKLRKCKSVKNYNRYENIVRSF